MVHSARSIELLLASFDVALPSEREKQSWIDWTIEISPSAHLSVPREQVAFSSEQSRNLLCAVHMCSHFGARVHRRHIPVGPCARRHRFLNILTVL